MTMHIPLLPALAAMFAAFAFPAAAQEFVNFALSREVLVRKADDGVAGERARGGGDCCNEPLLGTEMIVLARLDLLACVRLGAQVEAVAERLEQALLEQPQLRLERSAVIALRWPLTSSR